MNQFFYGLLNLRKASLHPFARLIRNELLLFGLAILDINYKQRTEYVKKLCLALSMVDCHGLRDQYLGHLVVMR